MLIACSLFYLNFNFKVPSLCLVDILICLFKLMFYVPFKISWGHSLGKRPIFQTVKSFFQPKLGTGESFRFWVDEWSGNGRLNQSFPRLFALALDPEGSVKQAWHNAWAPALPSALSEQRMLNFMRLHELLANQRPSAGPDEWSWSGQSFNVRAVYRRLREQVAPEDPLFLRLWRWVWKSRTPVKIRIFVWLLLR